MGVKVPSYRTIVDSAVQNFNEPDESEQDTNTETEDESGSSDEDE